MNGARTKPKPPISMLLHQAAGTVMPALHPLATPAPGSPVPMTVTGIPLTVYLSIARQAVELGCLGASALTATALLSSKTWA